MATSNLNFTRPTEFWYLEGLLSVYATLLALLAVYGFLIKDYWAALFIASDTALMFVSILSLLASLPKSWDTTFVIVIAEPILAGWFIPLHLSAVLVWTVLSTFVFSPLIILTLTDWNVETFFGKEFAFPPVVQLRSLLRRR